MLPSNWFENSACNGCEYGERVTSGVFCVMTQGLVPIGYQGCKAQNDFYEEQYKKENGITLAELAKKLRELFEFRWLTYDRRGDDWYIINLWISKPIYQSGIWWPKKNEEWLRQVSIDRFAIRSDITLDLTEIPSDADGNIDYSKCIVEVE